MGIQKAVATSVAGIVGIAAVFGFDVPADMVALIEGVALPIITYLVPNKS